MERVTLSRLLQRSIIVFLLVLATAKKSSGQSMITFIKQPNNATVTPGSPVSFDCSASSFLSITYSWQYMGKQIISSSDGRVTIHSDGTLEFTNAQGQDVGDYVCIASVRVSGREFKTKSQKAFLRLQNSIEPTLDSKPKPRVYANQGDDFTMACRASGTPTPTIQWYYETQSTPLISNSKHAVTSHGTLMIRKVQSLDFGKYRCVAKNFLNSASAETTLIEAKIMDFSFNPSQMYAAIGGDFQATCIPKGVPKPKVTWKNANGGSLPVSYVVKENTITIKDVKQSDSATVTCVATNIAGTKSANLEVKAADAVRQNPFIYNHNRFDKGSKVTVYCRFTGYGNITIKWQRSDGKPMSKNAVALGDRLTIYNVALKDGGIYICTGFNSFSNASGSVRFSVSVFPKFVLQPTNTTVVESGSAWLHCNATGYPKPQIIWGKVAKGGDQLDPERFFQFENGTLHVFNIKMSDQGWYYCYIGNIGNFKQRTIFMKVKTAVFPKFVLRPTNTTVPQNEASAVGIRSIAIAVGCAAAYIVLQQHY